jgi:hypothetical protein
MYSAVRFPFRCANPQDVSQTPNSTLHALFHFQHSPATQVEIVFLSDFLGLKISHRCIGSSVQNNLYYKPEGWGFDPDEVIEYLKLT